ncbi:hypothetical protein BKA69DRAFT_1058788 [Paraphysoderma sedebokerense]|nr:hypothetical protein BKA69DRAFT_1058788 [Paraphysoderma sedebokerense]
MSVQVLANKASLPLSAEMSSKSLVNAAPRSPKALCVDEILLNIFSHLDKPSLLNAVVVNRQFSFKASRLIWRNLAFTNFHGYLGLMEIVKILRSTTKMYNYASFVRSLSITYTNHQKGIHGDISLDNLFLYVARNCRNVRSLRLDVRNSTKLRSSSVVAAIAQLPLLDSVQLHCGIGVVTNETVQSLARYRSDALKHLDIQGPEFTDHGMLPLVQTCTHLKHLTIALCPYITSSCVLELFQHSRHLETLMISSSGLNDEPFANVKGLQCPSLKSLSLDLSGELSYVGVICIIRACPNLRRLHLQWANDIVLQEIAPYIESIWELSLTSPEVSPETCALIGHFCKELRWFRIEGYKPFGDVHLEKLLPAFENLWELYVDSSEALTDAGIRVASEHLKTLRWINITNCNWLTDMSVVALSNGCPNVETVRLQSSLFSEELIWQCLSKFKLLKWAIVEDLALTLEDLRALKDRHLKVWKALQNGCKICPVTCVLHLDAEDVPMTG